MNKRIIISLSVIGAVAAIAVGGTIAYFSDTETSTGNTFTAGELDLLVDIDGVVYNPLSNYTGKGGAGTIFSETDMKPGDDGEETISLHVDNDACGFVAFNLTNDLDNSCTEPEQVDEQGACVDPDGDGELNDEVNWVIWADMGNTLGWQCSDGQGQPIQPCVNEERYDPAEGDNLLNGQYDTVLTYGPLDENKEWGFGMIEASNVYYYGFAWCFGNISQDLACDGSLVGNEAQTDSFTADMILRAEQYRNQYDQNSGCPLGLLGD